MKKLIGMPGWVMESKYFGIGIAYAEYLRRFGQVVILYPDDPIRNDLDLLVLPGGADVTPHQHENSILSMYTGNSNPMLEYFDNTALPQYIDQGTPILGICRGAQKLWSYFGGTIIQHCIDHQQSSHNKDQAHALHFLPSSGLQGAKLNVTSRHHQLMSAEDGKPELLTPIALAIDVAGKQNIIRDDIVEIFKVDNQNIYGVQYHPEDNHHDDYTPSLINRLLNI